MYARRFIELLIIYLLSTLLAIWIFLSMQVSSGSLLAYIVASLAGYALLIVPLIVLTVRKASRKDRIVGSQVATGQLAAILSKLPGYIAFTVSDKTGKTATTIMSWTQDTREDNVFYMVVDPKASKIQYLQENPSVSWTTYFDDIKNGARLSSNLTRAEVILDDRRNELVKSQPNILRLSDNAARLAIIRLTVQSALFENFKDGLQVITFDKTEKELEGI